LLTKEDFINLGFSKGMSEALIPAFGQKLLPNPTVGAALIDENNNMVITASHKGKGTDHAEASLIKAILKLNIDTSKCTLFLTLEPCMHDDTSPSCAKLLAESKLFNKIVIGDIDPDVRTNGKGLIYMQRNNINVKVEVGATSFIDPSYMTYASSARPYIISKFGVTKDWSTYSSNNIDEYISSDYSRKLGHIIRNNVDAILIGKNTLLIDDPKLNIRYDLISSDPFGVVLWGNDINSKKFLHNYNKYSNFLFICNSFDIDEKTNKSILNKERVIFIDQKILTPESILDSFTQLNIHSLLLEGGLKTWNLFDSPGSLDTSANDKNVSLINRMYIFESKNQFVSIDKNYLNKSYINKKYTLLKNINYPEDSLYIYEKENQ